MRRRTDARFRWREHNRRRYEVAPVDGIRISVYRGAGSDLWLLSVDGVFAFGPEPLTSERIADAKREALDRIDRALLDLRIAVAEVIG